MIVEVVENGCFKTNKKKYLFQVEKYLERLMFGAFEKWLTKIIKVYFLTKIFLNFEELTRNALTSSISHAYTCHR